MQLRNLALFMVSVAACAEPDDARPASFDYVHATILEPYCATVGCHSASTDTPSDIPIDLSAPTQEACQALLRPEFPSLIRGECTMCNEPQMPLDIPLAEADQRVLLAWWELERAKGANACAD